MLARHVGRPVKRLEDPRLVTGRDPYVNDVRPPGALTMRVVRSPHAHAEILRVDVRAARAMAGVMAVVTGEEVNAEIGVIDSPVPDQAFDQVNRRGHRVLAEGRVRYVGEPVVAVVAETPEAAADAAEAVVVEYRPLPAVADAAAALEPGAPLLYPELGTNLAVRLRREMGDVDAAFRRASVVLEADLISQRVLPVALEPRACTAVWDPAASHLTVWGDTQVPHRMRDQIAGRLKLDPAQVRVVTARVGGGFGAKVPVYQEDTLVAWLARRLGRPIRWVADRSEDLQATGHGRDMRCRLRLAADDRGRILALDARIIGNVGFCLYHVGPILPALCGQMITGCYDIPIGRVEVLAAYTNTMGTVPYRGAGRPEAAYFIERGLTMLAARLGLDPVEVRRRNFIAPERFPYTTLMGLVYDSGDYAAALDRALERADYAALRRWQAEARRAGRLVGIGVGCYVEICGFEDDEVADVIVDADGAVTVLTGTASHGQGHETAYAQLVADELQVPLERVRVVHGDTARIRAGVGTFGSRSISRGGMHAMGNARRVKEQAVELAARLLEAAPADIVLEAGRFGVRGVPDRRVGWPEVVAAAGGTLASREDFKGRGTLFPFGAHVAVVEVDRETGRVRLLRYVSVDDSGFIVNPLLAQGQVHGGLAQGIGQALLEGAAYDASGQLLTATLMDYAVPKSDDLIAFDNDHTCTPSPRTALGVKGIGESATIGSTPTVANAVLDALAPLGITHLDLPLTPGRVWAALARVGAETGQPPTPPPSPGGPPRPS
jgi:carbon-monoxide dehydrogenase large subunit